MICGHSPRRPWRDKPRQCSQLCGHEIANGPCRQAALDRPHSLLVLCWFCNSHVVTNKAVWPEPRQLCLLYVRAPEDFDLVQHNLLVRPQAPNRITMEEVLQWISSMPLRS